MVFPFTFFDLYTREDPEEIEVLLGPWWSSCRVVKSDLTDIVGDQCICCWRGVGRQRRCLCSPQSGRPTPPGGGRLDFGSVERSLLMPCDRVLLLLFLILGVLLLVLLLLNKRIFRRNKMGYMLVLIFQGQVCPFALTNNAE